MCISPRPKYRNPARYVQCAFSLEGEECTQYGKRCTFAKSAEEADVWNFLKSRNLEHNALIHLVKESKRLLDPEGVVERIQRLFPGPFVHLCHPCFHSSPQQITAECPDKVCDHPPKPTLVLFQIGEQGDEVAISEVRALPLGLPHLRRYRHCWHVAAGGMCWYGPIQCSFPHSEVEMAVWTAESNEGLDRKDLLLNIKEQEAQVVALDPRPRFYCGMCQLQFYSQDGFVSHCSSLAHERRYCEDTTAEWKHRRPPENPGQALELCKRPEICEYGDNCTSAHSVEELQEWCLRMRMVHRKRTFFQEQGLLSYRDLLLIEYRDSHNEILIRPLKVAALLKQEPGATFTLGENTSGDPCTYSVGDQFRTLGASYALPVSFASTHPGHYEQWLVLDFDTRPVLLQKLRVGVGERRCFPKLAEDTHEGSNPAPAPLPTPLNVEPWHRGNKVIISYLAKREVGEELLKEYKPPRLNLMFNPAAESHLPLTRKNYRERMHSFLYREELAQEEVLSR
ncbi:hypothetical protein AAFF_G00421000 [Aldrovandia affinis]|uniref:C3H1-type domain-containing protein n=1 Tax=Aldrovandia affinis TaxID=143900 RepID=A0AAD7SA71_9TELE|nr:hypothetical protein AAFF_G00421000 [Aldrovandia affinis]